MPIPVSLTTMRMPSCLFASAPVSVHPACRVMNPPSGVNFTALESRLFSTRVIFPESIGNVSSWVNWHSQASSICLACASSQNWFTLFSKKGLSCTTDRLSRSPFCSRRRKSSNWLTRRSRSLALSRIFSSSFPIGWLPVFLMSYSRGVMISASGVRNSWLMLVKNLNLSSSRCCSFCLFRFSCSAIIRERLPAIYHSMA